LISYVRVALYNQDRTARKKAGIGQPATGQLKQHIWDRTEETGRIEQDSKERAAGTKSCGTRMLEEDPGTGQLRQNS
jgi:hypothetical protein